MSNDPPAPEAGAFASLLELRAVQARLGEQRRQGAEAQAFWDAALDFVERGRATGVVIDDEDERWTVQALLDYWAAALERAGRPRPDSSLVEFDPELAPELPDALCPYLGLNAFQETDSRMFFGRDALVDKLVHQLGEHRLVALVGPSGCGKSSLAFAGLASRLHKGALPGGDVWRILAMVPGAEPRAALASLFEHAAGDPAAADPPPAVVVVDQFEELFTLCKSESERVSFVGDLLALVTSASPPHRVVLTVRSDFESFVARYPALYEHYDAGRVAVTPPSATELRQAIEGPAALVDLKFEAGVIDRLLVELLGEPAGLPLLQFTLLRLWQERTRNRVTAAGYDRVGGGRQALARAADAVYDAMIPQDQMTARRILLLVGLAVDDKHERTRMRVPRSQFFESTDDPGRIERVLDRLIEARLLRQTAGRRGAAPQVEVAHEALVRNWPRLAEWLQEAQTGVARWLQQEVQAGIAEGRRLEAKAVEWVGRGRDRRALLDEVTLRQAERWRDSAAGHRLRASDELLELIDTSRRQVAAGIRRRRVALAGFAAVVVVVIATLSIAVWQFRNARSARGEASDSRAQREIETRRLLGMTNLEQGRSLLLDGRPVHPMRALPYLVAARGATIDSPVLRMLFAQASRGVRSVVFIGHRASIRKIAFSPDGTRVVTASDDNTARIWDPATGLPLTPPLAHLGAVYDAAFSPDGTRVVTASTDGTAQVWNAATGRPIGRPLKHHGAVASAVFSPDGEHVVTASADNTARVWDAATSEPITPPLVHQSGISRATFSPDGTRVATLSSTSVRFWNASTGNPMAPMIEDLGGITSVAFSPDGTRAITIDYQATARVWNTTTGASMTLPFQHKEVWSAAFSPDGESVLTTSQNKSASVWSASTGQARTPALAHQGPVNAAAFSPDGTRVVTASDDKTAQIWDASTGEPLGPPLEHQGAVLDVAFSPDGSAVLTASADKTAQLWDAATADPGIELRHERHVVRAAFSTDGTRVATVGTRRMPRLGAAAGDSLPELTAQVWDALGQPASPPFSPGGRVVVVAFSADATRALTANDRDLVEVWDTSAARTLVELPSAGGVMAAAFSPDNARIVAASRDNTVRIWDASTSRMLTPPIQHSGPCEVPMLAAVPMLGRPPKTTVRCGINTVAFAPDGTHIVTAGEDKAARIWNVSTGRLSALALHHNGAVMTAVFSHDGTRVVTASADNTAMVWDASTGEPVTAPLEHSARVVTAAFSPDGSRVVTASDDRTAQVWDVATGKPVAPPLEHGGAVTSAAFSPDGTIVVTASEDGTAQLWDVATGKPVMPPFGHKVAVNSAAFSPDGTRVVTASDDLTARIWNLPRDASSLERWFQFARCTPYTLVAGVLMNNPGPARTCPKHEIRAAPAR
jgi:WD40 repeat protein/energy-coupling factor transporter ATP-binding protein EcfA2